MNSRPIHRQLHRRAMLQAGAALGASLLLPSARACEFVTSNFKLIHPWTRASAADATTAAVCMAFEEVTESDRLIGAQTKVAERAELGGAGASPGVNFLIPEGQSSALSESGTYLLLVGLRMPLEVGRSYPMTLIFQKAGSVNAVLSIDYARFS